MNHIGNILLFSLICMVISNFHIDNINQNPDLRILETQTYLEGDLKFPMKRNAVRSPHRKWPNLIIPYLINYRFNENEWDQILRAMRSIEGKICIKFIPLSKSNQKRDYINIRPGDDGCYTTGVGYQRGVTEISLERPSCMRHGVIVHELLHVLGLWHEHMRYDRDQYVKIHYDNIEPQSKSQFNIISQDRSSTYDVPYDYSSIMHYGKRSFSTDGWSVTIQPLINGYSAQMMGRARDMSHYDILKVNRMYNCKTTSSATGTGTGGLPDTTDWTCRDLSSSCPSLINWCGKWDILERDCKKTCKLCSSKSRRKLTNRRTTNPADWWNWSIRNPDGWSTWPMTSPVDLWTRSIWRSWKKVTDQSH